MWWSISILAGIAGISLLLFFGRRSGINSAAAKRGKKVIAHEATRDKHDEDVDAQAPANFRRLRDFLGRRGVRRSRGGK